MLDLSIYAGDYAGPLQARVVQCSRRMIHGAISGVFGQLSATRLSYHDCVLGGIAPRVISVSA